MESIRHLFHINTTPQNVFEAIVNMDHLKKWYTNDIEGESKLNSRLKFKFGDVGYSVELIEIIENKFIKWACVDADEVFKEVIGHETTFDLEQVNGKTRIRFSQSGFSEKNDLYAGINYSWGKYLESLRQYLQTGIGEGFGTEKYRS